MATPSSQAPHLTRSTKAFVDALAAENNPPLYTLSPEAARTRRQSRSGSWMPIYVTKTFLWAPREPYPPVLCAP